MKAFVKQLLDGPALPPFGVLGALFLIAVALFLWGWGVGGAPDYDETQNTNFAAAVNERRVPAVAGTSPADRARIVLAANTYLQDKALPSQETLDAAAAEAEARTQRATAKGRKPADALPSSDVGAGSDLDWTAEHVCKLDPKGWGEHRVVVRRLVLEGYGDCGAGDRFAADSPWVHSAGGAGVFWLVCTGAFALLMALAAATLLLTRRVYHWQYRSRIC